MPFSRFIGLVICVTLGASSLATDPNLCDGPGDYPDVTVSGLTEVLRWGTEGEITAFSVGTTSCNVGTCELQWIPDTNQHPVIAQNMFRLSNGRFEQLGQSWLKHGFFPLSTPFCDTGCIPTPGFTLGVNCADPYSAGLNGLQEGLGPKSEVNPVTGEFPFPPAAGSQSGDTVFRRLQVRNDDIDPARNADALYFVEGQYISPDDAVARRRTNNASWAPVDLMDGGDPIVGRTAEAEPAIYAWQHHDRDVRIGTIDIPGDGRFIVGGKATPSGKDRWRYEYAVQNLNSDRAGASFQVPIPSGAVIENVGFHDVDYHSGEPYDGTDWSATVENGAIVWSTAPYRLNPNANALRWGTLYNFRFDADIGPGLGAVSLGLFRPGGVQVYPRPDFEANGVRTVVPVR